MPHEAWMICFLTTCWTSLPTSFTSQSLLQLHKCLAISRIHQACSCPRACAALPGKLPCRISAFLPFRSLLRYLLLRGSTTSLLLHCCFFLHPDLLFLNNLSVKYIVFPTRMEVLWGARTTSCSVLYCQCPKYCPLDIQYILGKHLFMNNLISVGTTKIYF